MGADMGNHIAMKLTKNGGPEPLQELWQVFRRAVSDRANGSWIATREAGRVFTQDANSQLLAFTELPDLSDQRVLVLWAKIDCRSDELPANPLARKMYKHVRPPFEAYWRLNEIVYFGLMEKPDLPGNTTKGKSVNRAFFSSKSQLSFAYWLPPNVCDL